MNSLVSPAATATAPALELHCYMASWKIEMTCHGCVQTAMGVLGDTATVTLATQAATRPVPSMAVAKALTEELEDVGLAAALVALEEVLPNDDAIKAHGEERMNSQQLNAGAGTATTDSICDAPQPAATQSQTVELMVGGMTCAMCSRAITQSLLALPGVINVAVSLATNVATVEYTTTGSATATQASEQMKVAIESVGYEVTQILSKRQDTKLEQLTQRQQQDVGLKKSAFLWSLVGTIPIMTMTMILPHALANSSGLLTWLHTTVAVFKQKIMRESLMLLGLASLVQFGSGYTFYRTSYHNVKSGQLGMDVLVALGTTASYLYACNEAWTGKEAHFFETSSVLIAFVLLGKWMNSLAVRRTSDALTQLMQLQSKTAIQIIPKDQSKIMWNPQASLPTSAIMTLDTSTFDPMVDAYTEQIVSVDFIHPKDTVKVLRGASIPADGVVSHGEMTVDESMITGESVPVLKSPGSLVLGGTVCQETTGAFVSVTGVGASTALAQIVQLVQDAQTRQVPIQFLADTISSVFVPTICIFSVITYMTWYALCMTGVVPAEWFQEEGPGTFSLMFGIACLVISCPCALGLATPTAVMVGTGIGAKHGILMKGGEALEAASKVDAVVFDKTGTLTKGNPGITDFWQVDEAIWDKEYFLWMLGSLERNSEHPLAIAVVAYTEREIGSYLEKNPFLQPKKFKAVTGRGASGTIDGVKVAVGNRSFCDMKHISISSEVERQMAFLEHAGKTAIIAAIEGKIAGVMGIADVLKSDAVASLAYLRNQMGVEVWMVTGDNARTARAISKLLGLSPDRVISEALPAAKVQQVKKLQAEGKIVAMIGDGINDSPALAQADVGMSLGTGAEIAAEAADMVLVRGHVQDVCTALDLSRVIFRRIQLNLFLSLVYNCLGIPVAAGVFYPLIHTRLPPTLAAVAMALSSFSVVSSSLALRLYKPPKVEVLQQDSFVSQSVEPTSSVNDNDLTQPLLHNRHDDAELRMEEGL